MERHCLLCYKPLERGEADSHPRCTRKMFGTALAPILPYDERQLEKLAEGMIRRQVTVSGVEPKICLNLEKDGRGSKFQRFSIADLRGGYILKPPAGSFSRLPLIEDLTMHMAESVRIDTVPHCLIRMQSGSLAYLTRRIDRSKSGKVHMEDMCQITGRLTGDKYNGSYEQIALAIDRHSANPGLDVIKFFEMVVFCFLCGNADMHLKNFSLVDSPERGGISLAPAYGMVSTALVDPQNNDELALTLNGKKKGITQDDFRQAFDSLSVNEKVRERMFRKFQEAVPLWERLIDSSFLDNAMQNTYKELIRKKSYQLRLFS
ncbi:MAG: HipA domain-containing protein [Chlorobiaceae bacterium]|nr:HipA domain-containing protein [Chlorobiaceae bacterium]NTW11250.1 HipA domain-containing protein [Chlorobiaceae bacterium]